MNVPHQSELIKVNHDTSPNDSDSLIFEKEALRNTPSEGTNDDASWSPAAELSLLKGSNADFFNGLQRKRASTSSAITRNLKTMPL